MKAVLGFLFILAGITIGWLVLSGQLPNTSAAAPIIPQIGHEISPDQSGDTGKRATPIGTLTIGGTVIPAGTKILGV